MSNQKALINAINLKELEDLFSKLNGGKNLPACFIIDDFCFDNKYLHVVHDCNSYQIKFFILNDSFLENQLSFLFELVKNPTSFDIEQIWINTKNISNFLLKNDIENLNRVLTDEISSFIKKKEPKSFEIKLVFIWTISANTMAYCSIYF